jgi:hypothetical protein
MPSPEYPFCGVSSLTTTREREKKNWNHERGMDRWNRKIEKTDQIYEENTIFPWSRTTCVRSRTNHKELQREEYKWTGTLVKNEKKREK